MIRLDETRCGERGMPAASVSVFEGQQPRHYAGQLSIYDIPPKERAMRPRYYMRTSYHVWTILRRADCNMDESVRPDSEADSLVEHIGARGRGDAAARQLARETVDRLNQGEC